MKLLFESWRKFLKEEKLRVFDFDDTLATTESMIVLRKADGTVIEQTPGEWAVYVPEPGDEFDYSQFRGPLINPQEMKDYTNILRNVIRAGRDGRHNAILTARGDGARVGIVSFLRDIGIDPDELDIVTLGSSDPMDKAAWIADKIEQGYDDVAFFDDSEKNVAAVRNLKRSYPNVKLDVRHVKSMHEGRDWQKDSVRITQHAQNKKDLMGGGGNPAPAAGLTKTPSWKRGKSAPPAALEEDMVTDMETPIEITGDSSNFEIMFPDIERESERWGATRRGPSYISVKADDDNSWTVSDVEAKQGYGPLLYDLAMEFINVLDGEDAKGLKPGYLISNAPVEVWDYYLNKRDDVEKERYDGQHERPEDDPESLHYIYRKRGTPLLSKFAEQGLVCADGYNIEDELPGVKQDCEDIEVVE